MLANVESWKKWQAGSYDLRNPPGDIAGEKLCCLWCLYSVRDSCVNYMWKNNTVVNFMESLLCLWHAWHVVEKGVYIPVYWKRKGYSLLLYAVC